VGEVESVTVTVTEKMPPAAGVPLITPADEIDKGDGSPVALQVRGALPPLAVSVVL
jgi:hypothetical protein